MTEDQKYNGWTNYETWCVNLWLSNDEFLYHMIQDQLEAEHRSMEDYEPLELDDWPSWFSDMVEDLREQSDTQVTGMFADLLGASLQAVDWYDIAEHWVGDFNAELRYEQRKEIAAGLNAVKLALWGMTY